MKLQQFRYSYCHSLTLYYYAAAVSMHLTALSTSPQMAVVGGGLVVVRTEHHQRHDVHAWTDAIRTYRPRYIQHTRTIMTDPLYLKWAIFAPDTNASKK